VRYLPDKKKQNFPSLSRSRFCADRAQNLSGPAPDNIAYSEYPKFHPNPFTSGGVIAKRVNIVETRYKVFPILGEASSPINQCYMQSLPLFIIPGEKSSVLNIARITKTSGKRKVAQSVVRQAQQQRSRIFIDKT